MTNIYGGNLDFSTSEDELQTLFAAYGAVKQSRPSRIAIHANRGDLRSSR